MALISSYNERNRNRRIEPFLNNLFVKGRFKKEGVARRIDPRVSLQVVGSICI